MGRLTVAYSTRCFVRLSNERVKECVFVLVRTSMYPSYSLFDSDGGFCLEHCVCRFAFWGGHVTSIFYFVSVFIVLCFAAQSHDMSSC